MNLSERRKLQAAADAEVFATIHTATQAEAALDAVRAKLDGTPYEAPEREKLEARSRSLCEFLRQVEPDSPALKMRGRPIKPTLAQLEADVSRDRAFSTIPDATSAAAELKVVRDEIAVVDAAISRSQAAEAAAVGEAATQAAGARSIDLYRRRDALSHRMSALREFLTAAWPSHPALRV